MKVHRCTKCEKRGGHLVFRQTKKNVQWKYPYVGHYDPTKKSKRKWCSLSSEQLNMIEFTDDWYYDKYVKIIQKVQPKIFKDKSYQVPEKTLILLGKLLENNGFLKYRIADRIFHNLTHYCITEKFIEDILPDKFSDKNQK